MREFVGSEGEDVDRVNRSADLRSVETLQTLAQTTRSHWSSIQPIPAPILPVAHQKQRPLIGPFALVVVVSRVFIAVCMRCCWCPVLVP